MLSGTINTVIASALIWLLITITVVVVLVICFKRKIRKMNHSDGNREEARFRTGEPQSGAGEPESDLEERESEARSGAMRAESSGDYSYVPNNIIVGLRTTRPAVLNDHHHYY